MPTSVFVYGTLMPGRLRWGLLAPVHVARRRVAVAGRLYDTGRGWPAARFDEDAVIPGWLVDVDPAALGRLLPELDEVEGAIAPGPDGTYPPRLDDRVPPGDYRRVVVTTLDGADAWAYEALAVDPAWVPIPAWDDQPER